MQIPLRQRLSYRISRNAVLIAILLGFLTGALQIWMDFHKEQRQIIKSVERTLDVVRQSAAEAVTQTNKAQAENVAQGLLEIPAISGALIVDDFGLPLAHATRKVTALKTDWLMDAMFGERQSHKMPLFRIGSENPLLAGSITVTIDNHAVFKDFMDRALLHVAGGILRNILLAILLISLFTRALTRPLQSMAFHYSAIDLDRPGAWDYDIEVKHRDDELGLLGHTINHMLTRIRVIVGELHRDRDQLRDTVEQVRSKTEKLPGSTSPEDEDPA